MQIDSADGNSNLPRIEDSGKSQPNAMTNDRGDWFYPDSPSDAIWFIDQHGARFVNGNPWTIDG